jgi:hypothetical protein
MPFYLLTVVDFFIGVDNLINGWTVKISDTGWILRKLVVLNIWCFCLGSPTPCASSYGQVSSFSLQHAQCNNAFFPWVAGGYCGDSNEVFSLGSIDVSWLLRSPSSSLWAWWRWQILLQRFASKDLLVILMFWQAFIFLLWDNCPMYGCFWSNLFPFLIYSEKLSKKWWQ